MAGTTPHVEQETLTLGLPGQEQVIAVGSPAWFSWLETATAFTFACPEGTFTARRERASSGRGGWYWRAEQRRAGVRRRAYLGKAEELTLEQLRAVAASLTRADAPAYSPRQPRSRRICTRRRCPGARRAADWNGDVPVYRHRGQHPAVGAASARRCGRRLPATTSCCGRRSAHITARSSRPSATASMPPSPARPTRLPPPWRPSGRCSRKLGAAQPAARAHGAAHRRGRAARRRLLRPAAQPAGAAAHAGPRRPDPALARDPRPGGG